jgi:hypothetical protein
VSEETTLIGALLPTDSLATVRLGSAGGILRAFPTLRLERPPASITGEMSRAPSHVRAVLA